LFIAEQAIVDHQKLEDERAEEVKKELETKLYTDLQSSSSTSDPRELSLKFMYTAPKEAKSSTNEQGAPKTVDYSLKFRPTPPNTGEDDMVKAFRAKLQQNIAPNTLIEKNELLNENDEYLQRKAEFEFEERNNKIKSNPNFGSSTRHSALEKDIGKRRRLGLTQEEQETRFSFLKNAPTVKKLFLLFLLLLLILILLFACFIFDDFLKAVLSII
jgi:hypothetical protein